MKRKILYINPVRNDDEEELSLLTRVKQENTKLEYRSLTTGPKHLEYSYYTTLISKDLLYMIREAEKRGVDAAVIGCFYDPVLEEAREITEKMIITAPCEASTHIACTLGYKFSIIVGRKRWIPQMMENVTKYGMKDKLASFKSVDLGVLDFHQDKKSTVQRFREAAKEVIKIDGAEVIILGCTGAYGFYEELQQDLGVPVIDASIAALKFAEFLVEIGNKFGWKHSKIGRYETPPLEEILNWQLGEAELWH